MLLHFISSRCETLSHCNTVRHIVYNISLYIYIYICRSLRFTFYAGFAILPAHWLVCPISRPARTWHYCLFFSLAKYTLCAQLVPLPSHAVFPDLKHFFFNILPLLLFHSLLLTYISGNRLLILPLYFCFLTLFLRASRRFGQILNTN